MVVATGCGCKEVYRYIDFLILLIPTPYYYYILHFVLHYTLHKLMMHVWCTCFEINLVMEHA